MTGDLESNYCHLLEGRLLPLFYRTNYLSNLFQVISFIKDSNVFLNFQNSTYVNSVVDVSTFITFNRKYIKKIKYQIYLKNKYRQCRWVRAPARWSPRRVKHNKSVGVRCDGGVNGNIVKE